MSDWKKDTSNCVEVKKMMNGDIMVRDSKSGSSWFLVFSPDEWRAFITAVKNGEFDYDQLED